MLRLFRDRDSQGALDIARRFEEPSTRKYGANHTATLRFRCIIGEALLALNKLDEALPYAQATFEAARANLGPAHPDTKIAGSVVYGVYAAKDDTRGMEKMRPFARDEQLTPPPPKPDGPPPK